MFKKRDSLILRGPTRKELEDATGIKRPNSIAANKGVNKPHSGYNPSPSSSLWIITAMVLLIFVLVQFKTFDYSANYPHVSKTYNDFLAGDCGMDVEGQRVGCDHDFEQRGIDMANVDALVLGKYDRFFVRMFEDEPKLVTTFSTILSVLIILGFGIIVLLKNKDLRFAILKHVFLRSGQLLFFFALIVLISAGVTLNIFAGIYNLAGFSSLTGVWYALLSPFVTQALIGFIFLFIEFMMVHKHLKKFHGVAENPKASHEDAHKKADEYTRKHMHPTSLDEVKVHK